MDQATPTKMRKRPHRKGEQTHRCCIPNPNAEVNFLGAYHLGQARRGTWALVKKRGDQYARGQLSA
jgi:hypothetical protein